MFSDVILGSCSAWSPSSAYIAVINSSRVTIRDGQTMEASAVHSCVDKIDKFAFSPDSNYIMCCVFSRNTVQIFSMVDSAWRCRINEGVAPIVKAEWTPDSRNIITVSDFGIQMSIWSLTENSSRLITQPKYMPSAGIYDVALQLDSFSSCCYSKGSSNHEQQSTLFRFSDCESYLAVVHRIDLNDYIGIYKTYPTWGEFSKFRCKTSDVTALHWSENSKFVLTVDSPLSYHINIYSIGGDYVAHFSAYNNALGVRSLVRQNSPQRSQVFAIGSYDSNVRLLSARSWRCAHILPLVHPKDMTGGLGHNTVIYSETTSSDGSDIVAGGDVTTGTKTSFVVNVKKELPFRHLTTKQKATVPEFPPKKGVSWIGWSSHDSYLACRAELHPSW